MGDSSATGLRRLRKQAPDAVAAAASKCIIECRDATAGESHAAGTRACDVPGKLSELVRHEGEYVLIHGDNVAGTFNSYQDALRQGCRQFGLGPFLVKQILSTEPVHYITRMIEPIAG